MNAVATIPTKSVTIDMANRYGMEPAAFEATLRQTIMPMSRGSMIQPTREEFAAFLLVAREYRLNPITRQIYAFPKKGGGIIPVVSVDGWAFLINEHPAFDGMEFEDAHNDQGHLLSVTCRIFRKDRRMPVSVTEYLSECKRDTDPWAMQHRMLRHKSLIQCARYAFAFSGIYDEDEAEKFAALPQAVIRNDAPPPAPRRAASEPPAAPRQIEHTPSPITAQPVSRAPVQDAEVSSVGDPEPATSASANSDDSVVTMNSLLTELDDRLSYAGSAIEIEEAYTDFDAEALLSDYPGGVEAGRKMKAQHLDRVAPANAQAEPVDDFPGNEALAAMPPAAPSYRNPTLASTADPFAIPEFKGGGHYQVFIRAACDAAKTPEHEERLRLIWAQTKPQRSALAEEGQLDNTDVKGLLADLQATFARIQAAARPADEVQDDLPPPAPKSGPEATQEPPDAPRATETAPAPERPASDDPVAAYTERLSQMLDGASAKDGLQRAWFADADMRQQSGASEAQLLSWKATMQRRKADLPEKED